MKKLKSIILINTNSIKKRLNIFSKKFIKSLSKLSYDKDVDIVIQEKKYKISDLPNILLLNYNKLVISSKPSSYNNLLREFINECKNKSEDEICIIYKKYHEKINDINKENTQLLYFYLDSLKVIRKEIKNKNIIVNESTDNLLTDIDLFIYESENLDNDDKIQKSKKEIKKLIKITLALAVISLSLIVFIKHHSDKKKIKSIDEIENVIKNKEKEIKKYESNIFGRNFISEDELNSSKAKIIKITGELSTYKDMLEKMKYDVMINSSNKYTKQQLEKQKEIVGHKRRNDENIYINNIINYKNESEENDMNIDEMLDDVINESASVDNEIIDYTFENIREILYEAANNDIITVEEREKIINEVRDAYINEATDIASDEDEAKKIKSQKRKTVLKIAALCIAISSALVIAKKVIAPKLKESKHKKELESLNNQLNNLTFTSRTLIKHFNELKKEYMKDQSNENAYKQMLQINSQLVIIQRNIKNVCVKLDKTGSYINKNSALNAAIHRLDNIQKAHDTKADNVSVSKSSDKKVKKRIENDKKYFNSMKTNKKKFREFYNAMTGEEMDESVSITDLFDGLEDMITEMYINNELTVDEASTIMCETESIVLTDDVLTVLEHQEQTIPSDTQVKNMEEEIMAKRAKTIKMIKRALIVIAATVAIIIATRKILNIANRKIDKKIDNKFNNIMKEAQPVKDSTVREVSSKLDKAEKKLKKLEKELEPYLNDLLAGSAGFTHEDMAKTEALMREVYATREQVISIKKKVDSNFDEKKARLKSDRKNRLYINSLVFFDENIGPHIWDEGFFQGTKKFYDKSCALVGEIYDEYDYMSEAYHIVKKVKIDKVKQSIVYANTICSLTKSMKHADKNIIDKDIIKSLNIYNSIASSALRILKKYLNNIDKATDADVREVNNNIKQVSNIRNKLRKLATSKFKIDISKIDAVEKQKLEKIENEISKNKATKNIKKNLKSIAVKESVCDLSNKEIYDKVVSALYEQCDYGEISVKEREQHINEAKEIFLSEGFDIRDFWDGSDTAANPYLKIPEKESIKIRKKINLPEYIKDVSYALHAIRTNNKINESKKYLLMANKSLIKSISEINKLSSEKICGIVPWLTRDVLNCINTYSSFATSVQNQIVKNKMKNGDYDNFADVQKMKKITIYNETLTKSLLNIQRFNDWKMTENMMKQHKSTILAALALLSDYTAELADNLVKLPTDATNLFDNVVIFF